MRTSPDLVRHSGALQRRPGAHGGPRYGIGGTRGACPVRGAAVEARLAFAVPGDLATPTGGYRYDGHIIEELGRLGWQVDVLDVGDGFPFPSAVQRAKALAMLSAVPGGCPIVLDGRAFGALPEAGVLQSRTPLIALVHQPLALEAGLDTT